MHCCVLYPANSVRITPPLPNQCAPGGRVFPGPNPHHHTHIYTPPPPLPHHRCLYTSPAGMRRIREQGTGNSSATAHPSAALGLRSRRVLDASTSTPLRWGQPGTDNTGVFLLHSAARRAGPGLASSHPSRLTQQLVTTAAPLPYTRAAQRARPACRTRPGPPTASHAAPAARSCPQLPLLFHRSAAGRGGTEAGSAGQLLTPRAPPPRRRRSAQHTQQGGELTLEAAG